ncbi:succinyl-diaminopimelate desuccinylase [Pseudoroseomonas wenyumeiae]|uniref:Succinyl-diaminopimelate desuccinylase n=1 Tax=Teichococcus wenyumeiae TaxID=2478470 RepID=A0A3A9JL43_9PROT|nr:succinyl-diaminopimelate desuccinylase [Pseudoroseomonas wenyumeiae]RKK05275.1 succinyl-diaminopimelate desuccinylase [Pseudoroseomonas wenyumeiae]RMI26072.1 succinyl-diaminopimelate desuccinylase [Pseudoroseomonas wenyumeiae]
MDPLPLLQDLIRCPSVTPADAGAMAVLEAALVPLGFTCTRLRFGEIENLFARRGTEAPHLCFAGHTDVVPPGDAAGWNTDPFGAEVRDGTVYGRGAVDMKGGIAAWIAAVASLPRDLPGSLSLLITGDEEGPATDGTVRVLEWMEANGQIPDMCIVGEPTSKAVLGDTIKIGRRGSMNVSIALHGVQGHSAYPQRADNPIHRLVRVLHQLTAEPLDAGSEWFEPSTLQVTSFDVGNPATNVIPPVARARMNIRFNDLHSSAKLTARIRDLLEAEGARYELDVSCSGESFLTQPGDFVSALQSATRQVTGVEPALDTGGGTSDARFIARYCPVAELGAVGTTMHKANESTPVEELRALSRLYATVIAALLPARTAA